MTANRENIDVLLINPPLGTIANPYISIALLKSHLSSKQIKVKAFDLNQEFLFRFITPQNIQRGKAYLESQFTALNDKKSLSFNEAFEYSFLSKLRLELVANKDRFKRIFFPFSDFTTIQQSNITGFLFTLSSLPFYPECVSASGIFRYFSRFSEFSSNDIIRSTSASPFYARETEAIIDELLLECNPKIVGLSVAFQHQILPAFWCARKIKEKNPHVHVTLGGTFVSVHLRDTMNTNLFSLIDSLILDEGETSLEELLRQVEAGKPDFRKVPGIRFLEEKEIVSAPSALPLDMNFQPPPDYNSFNLDGYLSPKKYLIAPFRMSKGCFWKKCSFCKTNIAFCQNFQQPQFETVYEQLKTVIDSTGIRNFVFSDESANLNLLSYIATNLIKESIRIEWTTHSRVDVRFTRERGLLFKEAGCTLMSLGVETFNNRLLAVINKGITAEQSMAVIEQIAGVIPLHLYMMVGIPTQTEPEAWEDYNKVVALLKRKLIARYSFSPLGITFGSAMWNNPEQYGIKSLKPLANEDLHPNIFDFACDGMSRKRANQLALEFLNKGVFQDVLHKYLQDSAANNFDLQEIQRILFEQWDFMYHPYDFLSDASDSAAVVVAKTS